MKIGFIGTGQMGKRMSKHLLDAGYDLAVHDLTKEAAQHLLERGARWIGGCWIYTIENLPIFGPWVQSLQRSFRK